MSTPRLKILIKNNLTYVAVFLVSKIYIVSNYRFSNRRFAHSRIELEYLSDKTIIVENDTFVYSKNRFGNLGVCNPSDEDYSCCLEILIK